MQDNKIFKPKEDGGCYEILILKISPRTTSNKWLKKIEKYGSPKRTSGYFSYLEVRDL